MLLLKPGGRPTGVPLTAIFEIMHVEYADYFVSLVFQSFNAWNYIFLQVHHLTVFGICGWSY